MKLPSDESNEFLYTTPPVDPLGVDNKLLAFMLSAAPTLELFIGATITELSMEVEMVDLKFPRCAIPGVGIIVPIDDEEVAE